MFDIYRIIFYIMFKTAGVGNLWSSKILCAAFVSQCSNTKMKWN